MATTVLTEDMLTIAPGLLPVSTCFTIWRATAWPIRKAPLRLTLITLSKSASEISRMLPEALIPALLMRMSMAPCFVVTSTTILST